MFETIEKNGGRRIHATAVVHAGAALGEGVVVGPYCVIDEGVTVGAGCELGPGVYLTGRTTLGERNRFHAGCVIGDAPQDLKYRGEATELRVGSGNVFREHVTVHRSNKVEAATTIGDGNLFMAGCHVGHNCEVGSNAIFANGALLGGHVIVADRVFVSGNCLVHQFCRIGRLALMQGGAAISKDLPPFTIARGDNGMCGLNVIGLRRAGVGREDRLALKRVYRELFRTGRRIKTSVEEARAMFESGVARELIDFVAASKRGICADTERRRRGGVGESADEGGEQEG